MTIIGIDEIDLVVQWREPDGGGRSQGFRLKVDADRHTVLVENSKLTGTYVDARAGWITFKERGELFGLTVDRVDFLRRQLTVDRQLLSMPGGEPYFAPPKTPSSYRTIPLPQVVVDTLAAPLPRSWLGPTGCSFRNDKGFGIRRMSFSSVWAKARAKVPVAPTDATMHDLRHSDASLVIRRGGR